jgi:hypothetical protein
LADIKNALLQIKGPNDPADVGKSRVQLLTALTSHIGSSIKKEQSDGREQPPVLTSASVNIGEYSEFMERYKGKNIEPFNASGVFYNAGISKVIPF